MEWGELIKSVWFWIITTIGGGSLLGLVGVITYTVVRGRIVKELAKINTEKIVENVSKRAIESVIGSVKKLSFEQSIQPVAEAELRKIAIEVQEMVKKELGVVAKKYDKLYNILEALARYFDNSIGVSDEAKAKMKEALNEAKEEISTEETEEIIKVEEVIVEDEKTEKNGKKTEKKTKIER